MQNARVGQTERETQKSRLAERFLGVPYPASFFGGVAELDIGIAREPRGGDENTVRGEGGVHRLALILKARCKARLFEVVMHFEENEGFRAIQSGAEAPHSKTAAPYRFWMRSILECGASAPLWILYHYPVTETDCGPGFRG